MDIFFKPDMQDQDLFLDPVESSHCIRVLRHQRGDRVIIIDGKGGRYIAEILEPDPKRCGISVVSIEQDNVNLPYELHIAIAPTKNIDRFEWFLEKATEIGITSIRPILCKRSERKQVRLDRLEKVIIAAMKQSGKAYKPLLKELSPFESWLKEDHTGLRMIAHCMDGSKKPLWAYTGSKAYNLLIGPEGDFTEEEVQLAVEVGFQPVSLGDYRLRTETAGVVACSAIYACHH